MNLGDFDAVEQRRPPTGAAMDRPIGPPRRGRRRVTAVLLLVLLCGLATFRFVGAVSADGPAEVRR